MTALTRFDTTALNRALVGFDQMFDSFDSRFASQLSNNYPPYNILKIGDNNYAIEIAIAGFKKSEITVEIESEQLSISGVKTDKSASDNNYLHRGLSARGFVRQFALAEHMYVNGAVIQDGILTIQIERIIPDEKKARIIDIVNIK